MLHCASFSHCQSMKLILDRQIATNQRGWVCITSKKHHLKEIEVNATYIKSTNKTTKKARTERAFTMDTPTEGVPHFFQAIASGKNWLHAITGESNFPFKTQSDLLQR